MDTLSHILVGGIVGHMALGHRVGGKAMAWGAAAAVLPDVDVAIGRLLSDLNELTFHRGPTHSVLFVLALAGLLAYVASRVHSRADADWRGWAPLFVLVLLSHLLLDSFTSYGTQLLLPFSEVAFSLASVSVIDPLFTLPLLLALPLMVILARRGRPGRWPGALALGLCGAYLAMTLVSKAAMQSAFERELAAQGIEAQRLFVKPTLFNNVLWRGLAETEDAYWVGFRSLLDTADSVSFQRFEKNHHLLRGWEGSEALSRLQRVSEGYLKAERRGAALVVHDMRYGKGFEWMETERDFVFTYRLIDAESIQTLPPQVDRARERASLRELLERIRGV